MKFNKRTRSEARSAESKAPEQRTSEASENEAQSAETRASEASEDTLAREQVK